MAYHFDGRQSVVIRPRIEWHLKPISTSHHERPAKMRPHRENPQELRCYPDIADYKVVLYSA
ncbi:unnamed protein product, partial [Dovyalis caffra]